MVKKIFPEKFFESDIKQNLRGMNLVRSIRSGKLTREEYIESRSTAHDPAMLEAEKRLYGSLYDKILETGKKGRR